MDYVPPAHTVFLYASPFVPAIMKKSAASVHFLGLPALHTLQHDERDSDNLLRVHMYTDLK